MSGQSDSPNLAHYTRGLMHQLERYGTCSLFWTALVCDRYGENPNPRRAIKIARGRMHNAARHLGVRIRTWVEGDLVHGEVIDVPR